MYNIVFYYMILINYKTQLNDYYCSMNSEYIFYVSTLLFSNYILYILLNIYKYTFELYFSKD